MFSCILCKKIVSFCQCPCPCPSWRISGHGRVHQPGTDPASGSIGVEKYKLDLVELRDSIYNKQTNTLDYNRWCATVGPVTMSRSPMCVSRLRPSVTLPEHFYCPSTAREALLSQQRDIPAYNKVDHTFSVNCSKYFFGS